MKVELVKSFEKRLTVIPAQQGIRDSSFSSLFRTTYSLRPAIFLHTAFCLLLTFFLPAVVLAAARPQVMDTIKQAVMTELVRTVSANVELDGIRILKGLDTLDEDKSYTVRNIAMDGYNGRNKIVYLVSLYDDRQMVFKVRVEAAYDVLTDIFVAAKPISSNTIITEEDVYTVKQKNSRLPSGAITDISEIKGRKLKSNIAQGVILRSDNFINTSNIKKGREVIVLVEGASMQISTRGVLNHDAVVGGVARVLLDSKKKEVSGILVSADTVKVKI